MAVAISLGMMFNKLLQSVSLSLLVALPIACTVESGEPAGENVGESYELLRGERDAARCVDRPMRRDQDDRISCRAVEVRRADADGRCDCAEPGRRTLERDERERVLRDVERNADTRGRDLACACELRQLERDAARACEESRDTDVRDERGERVHGWCGERIERGVDEELDRCDGHGIRLVGDARLRPEAEVMIRCE